MPSFNVNVYRGIEAFKARVEEPKSDLKSINRRIKKKLEKK